MSLKGKIWGRTEVLLNDPLVAVHRLRIRPHSQCSKHRHQFKWNAFLVLSGQLFIEVEKNDYDLVDVTELGPGDFTTVPPGEKHWFRTESKSCVAVEIYYLGPLTEDIIRDNVGASYQDNGTKTNKGRARRGPDRRRIGSG